MIILSPKKIKKNFCFLLENYKNSINNPYIECPYCKNTTFTNWGSYNRNVYYIEESEIIFEMIKINRVKCKECGHTHALLPEFIVPYKQYCLDVILYAISDDDIIYNYSFSENTIHKWKVQFNKYFLPYLKTLFKNTLNKIEIITNIKFSIFEYYEKFYITNKKILMMTKFGVFNIS